MSAVQSPLSRTADNAHRVPSDTASGLGLSGPRRAAWLDRRQKRPEPSELTSLPERRPPKRTASVTTDSARDEHPDNLSSSTANTAPHSANSVGSVCLCPPEPKIPRPRNAFMLYRQHYQSAVVADHPGLANPEISKIIGLQWREESQEVRDNWDKLAEEEKARHHRQYPNYKYQPRRKSKKGANLADSESPTDDWCSRCGRRALTTPATPVTPFTPASRSSTSSAPPGGQLAGRTLPPVYNTRTPESCVIVPRFTASGAPSSDETDNMSPPTPDSKRRRFNANTVSPPHYGLLNSPQFNSRQLSLLRSDLLPGRMEPPPRPSGSNGVREAPDPSLTLPPLQTAQSRSVEAMVMTIPHLSKIKVLSKISPPLAPPGPASPVQEVRGAVVAVEGEDETAVLELTRWLRIELEIGGRNVVKIIEAPDEPEEEGHGRESFVRYLKSIAAWHYRAREMVDFITTIPSLARQTTSTGAEGSRVPDSRTPVALIPQYMLSRSNHAAMRIPIDDAYAPVDHWQWAATLWRGITGPDLTIWIRDCSKDEVTKGMGVEIREDVRTLIVRRDRGEALEGRALRRLGFEVGEAVRAIAAKDETTTR